MNCTRCGHPLADHCKGNEPHANHKEDARMVPLLWRRLTIICVGKHCLQPLCSCIEFLTH